jgi:GABA(A) receptor-associated protein
MIGGFKNSLSLEKRQIECQKIITKYPDRIPIIVEKLNEKNNDVPNIDKNKYLVPCDLTIGQFQFVIRKRIKLDSQKALFIFINNKLPVATQNLKSVYENEKDEDGFLYVTYSGENTFGK